MMRYYLKLKRQQIWLHDTNTQPSWEALRKSTEHENISFSTDSGALKWSVSCCWLIKTRSQKIKTKV